MQVFPITTYPWKAFACLAVVTVGCPLALAAIALVFSRALPDWLFILAIAIAIGFVLSVNVALTALALYVATRNEVTIRDATMHLKGGEFHERVPLDSVVRADMIDLVAAPILARAKRRNGIVLPGFRVGWFEYGNSNKRWLFVLRAARSHLLYIETNIGFDVLLGVQDPDLLAHQLLRRDKPGT